MKVTIKKYQYEFILAGSLFLSLLYIALLDFIGNYASEIGLLVCVIVGAVIGHCINQQIDTVE